MKDQMEHAVKHLASEFPKRHFRNPSQLQGAREWIVGELQDMGYEAERESREGSALLDNTVTRQEFTSTFWTDGRGSPGSLQVQNLIVNLPGDEALPWLVVGAHYDSRIGMLEQRGRSPWFDWDSLAANDPRREFQDTPGANDNGSGVAATLALAKAWRGKRFRRPVQLVFWVNEEYPFYGRYWAGTRASKRAGLAADGMGSFEHAKSLRESGASVLGVIAFDTCGIYGEGRGHETGGLSLIDKIAVSLYLSSRRDVFHVLSNYPSRSFAHTFDQAYHKSVASHTIGSSCSVIPIRKRRGWSDDWGYWQHDFPAFCISDGAYLRSRTYHRTSDLAETLNYDAFATAWEGWREAMENLLMR